MEPMQPDVMIRQVEDLPQLTRTQLGPIDRAARAALANLPLTRLQRIITAGNGDSYHAVRGCELAFTTIGGIANEPLSAQRFLDYGVALLPPAVTATTLVGGVSASGGTGDVAQLLTAAREGGAPTLAITGAPGSRVAQSAEQVLPVTIPDFGRSPGIRTYHASLLSLLLLAINAGELRQRIAAAAADDLRREIGELEGILAATLAAAREPARAAAQLCREEPFLLFLGSGPSYGTALFAAAKVVEASAVFAAAQELEEWWHVERFAYPAGMVTFLIAPPGHSYQRAVELAAGARQLGRRLIAVVREGDTAIARHAEIVLPVAGEVREAFSPLVYHLFAGLFAAFLAQALGRAPLQSDNPFFQAAIDNYYAGRGSR
jgi:glutamine---fructose-6-phosphate transaminase (isomerizing)